MSEEFDGDPQKSKTDLVLVTYRNPEKIESLKQRFADINALVDPVDRLLMLKALEKEVGLEKYQEYDFSVSKVISDDGALVLTMVGSIGAGLVGALVIGPFAGLAFLPVLAGGLVYLCNKDSSATKRYNAKYSDIRTLEQMHGQINKDISQSVKTADTKMIALSPRAEEVFEEFPSLREKFILAQTIDKVRTDHAEENQIPRLDKASVKPSPPSSGIL